MRKYKPNMGVEGPSFREQQERRQRELEAKEKQGRDQPKVQEPAPKHQDALWNTMFGPRTAAGAVPPTPPPPSQEQQSFQRQGFGLMDPNKWLKVADIWNYVGQVRISPNYRGGGFAVDTLTPAVPELHQAAGEVAQFFGIPAASFQGLSLEASWKEVIGPFIRSLEISLNRMKPFVIPGGLSFELGDRNELMLVYKDR